MRQAHTHTRFSYAAELTTGTPSMARVPAQNLGMGLGLGLGSTGQGRIIDTHTKALTINLDARRYGTFAEIGAGQEVVRWFFRVGGAAGTIAKSMSAYDMTVSDAIYGKADRYVCRQRLQAMLDHEYTLNLG